MTRVNVTRFNPYETVFSGPYGTHTASIDWCEYNYTIFPWLAEFWNCLSMLPVLFVSVVGLLEVVRYKLPRRMALPYIGVISIGLGSIGFHATLSRTGQLADEIPMLLFVTLCSLLIVDVHPGNSSLRIFDKFLPTLLFSINLIVSAIYIYNKNFLFFTICFATFLISGVARGVYVKCTRSFTPQETQNMNAILIRGSSYFVLAFFIWNLDNLLCRQRMDLERHLSPPFSTFLQGHALWHLLSNYASLVLGVGAQYLNMLLTEPKGIYELRWRMMGTVPYLTRISTPSIPVADIKVKDIK